MDFSVKKFSSILGKVAARAKEALPSKETVVNTTKGLIDSAGKMAAKAKEALPSKETVINTTKGIIDSAGKMAVKAKEALPSKETVVNTTKGIIDGAGKMAVRAKEALPSKETVVNTTKEILNSTGKVLVSASKTVANVSKDVANQVGKKISEVPWDKILDAVAAKGEALRSGAVVLYKKLNRNKLSSDVSKMLQSAIDNDPALKNRFEESLKDCNVHSIATLRRMAGGATKALPPPPPPSVHNLTKTVTKIETLSNGEKLVHINAAGIEVKIAAQYLDSDIQEGTQL